MALTERDYALFEPARAPLPPVKPKPKREPIRQVRPPREEPVQSKNERAHQIWMRSLAAYAVSGVVALCLFMVIQTEAEVHRAMVKQQELYNELEAVQQVNISCQTQLEHKFSLEVIQKAALEQYHMAPIESGRVTYLNIKRGDQRLD